MKKLLTAIMSIVLMSASTVNAQVFNRGVFDHLGAGLSVGSEGIGLSVATTLSPYVELSGGVDFMPAIKPSFNINVSSANVMYDGTPVTIPVGKVNVKANAARTTFNFKVSAYPFGDKSSFFVAAGLSFGGEKILDVYGESETMKAFLNDPTVPTEVKNAAYAEIGKFDLKFDKNGAIDAEVLVHSVRPYLGLGLGRQVPKNRVGFRFEAGVQFMGKMKVYQGDKELLEGAIAETGDKLSKVVNKLTVYPVVRFTLTGRIL